MGQHVKKTRKTLGKEAQINCDCAPLVTAQHIKNARSTNDHPIAFRSSRRTGCVAGNTRTANEKK